jgi:hypothetical protein
VVDDNSFAAIAMFWAVCWIFVGWLHLKQLERLLTERERQAAVTNLMTLHLTDEQFAEFQAQLQAADAIEAAESNT